MFSLKQEDDTFRVKRTIGSSYNIDEDDVRKTKSALRATGDYKPPNWGMTGVTDDGMFDGLKKFQKREGLQVDGIMRPGGPTEKKLRERTSTAKPPTLGRPSSPPAGKAGIVEGEHELARRKTDIFGNPLPQSRKQGPLGKRPSLGDPGIDLGLPTRTEQDRDRSQETQVAVAPVVNLLLQAANRFGPAIARSLPPAAAIADKAGKEAANRGHGDDANYPPAIPPIPEEWQIRDTPPQRQQADPPPSTPGFEPPDEPGPDREEFPENKDFRPATEIFPNPEERQAILETFPIDDSLGQWIILEHSRGDDETQAKNDVLIELYTNALKKRGIKAEHTHGARTAVGKNYRKERYLKPSGGIGAARPDGSFQVGRGDDKAWLDFNTVDNLKDGRTPNARERKALAKIRRLYEEHKENSDITSYPKQRGVELEEWRENMRPLVEEYFDSEFWKKWR